MTIKQCHVTTLYDQATTVRSVCNNQTSATALNYAVNDTIYTIIHMGY